MSYATRQKRAKEEEQGAYAAFATMPSSVAVADAVRQSAGMLLSSAGTLPFFA